MRVVFYSLSTTLYGAPTSLLNLIEGLVKDSRYKIFVIVPGNGPLTDELRKFPVQVIRLPFFKWVYNFSLFDKMKKANAPYAWLWFYKNVLQKVLLNLFWFPFHLVKIRSLKPDIIYTNTTLSPMGILVAKMLKIKSLWHHRETINDQETDFFLEWNERLAYTILNWPEYHLHPSYYLKSTYDSYISSGQTFVVYNGVGSSSGVTPRKLEQHPPLRFGMVGRISPQKGQREIIESISDFTKKQMSLTLYGSGEKHFIDQLEEDAPDFVCFNGFQPQPEIYKAIDFLIINARNESFGRVVAEAYSYGVPVISRNSGALPELVVEGETGFLFSNKESLTAILSYLVSGMARSVYQDMSGACIKRFQDHYTIGAYAKRISDILITAKHDY